MKRLIMILALAAPLGACAHRPETAAAQQRQAGRETALAEFGARPAQEQAVDAGTDNFIEVDDRHALKKSWPMALMLALLLAACGAF